MFKIINTLSGGPKFIICCCTLIFVSRLYFNMKQFTKS